MILTKSPNINALWANLIVEELVRNGITYFCLSPGSRSAPLTIAIAEHNKCMQHIHFDERASAFHALGYSSATGKPSVVVTTSGSAVANIFPAIIEASKKKIPLIIITADRPPELRFTGANQTIDQVKIFGAYTRWFVDMPTPTEDILPAFVLTTIDQAVNATLSELKGPVHLNCMFREPLAPTVQKLKSQSKYLKPIDNWIKGTKPYTTWFKPQQTLANIKTTEITDIINGSKEGIIAVGKLANPKERKAALQLAEQLNWPIFADISSGLRLGQTHKHIITYFDQILLSSKCAQAYQPKTIIHLGGRMTSKRFYNYIEQIRPRYYITALNHPLRNDPLHCVTHRVQAATDIFLKSILKSTRQKKATHFLKRIQEANRLIHAKIDEAFETSDKTTEFELVRMLSRTIPDTHNLFLSNSLIIREMDSFADGNASRIKVNANRGTSGIDGIIASACGYTNGSNKPTTLVIGDLAALYDLNAFIMLKQTRKPVVTIIFNNNGGGIFSFLPISKYKQFEKYFGTPHNINFGYTGKLFNIPYVQTDNVDGLYCAYHNILKTKKSAIIEVTTDRAENLKFFQKWEKKIIQMI